MNLFLHELKAYRKSILIWAGSMAAVAALFILIFSSLLEEIEAFKAVLNSMPEVLRRALSIYVDSISTLEGFYSIVFVYILLCGAIQAMNLGLSIVSKEVRDKTAEFLLTKPISRQHILTSKLLAALASLVMTNLIYWGITLLMTLTVKAEFNLKIFFMITAPLLFIQLMFLSLGVFVSVVAGKIKSVNSISLSTVFAFFIISTLGSVLGDETVRFISPFKYFDSAYIIKNAAYESSYPLIGILFILIAIGASYRVYVKKDIHTV
ncbi:ABC transporter permease subunit [Desulfitobacterium metallireducens]|uniref:ABC transporter permease n=1 Tax=Desulfitobacterium metallireducens DSM 15288 TaxID=871968 RepID=W0EFR8_9FIRM|nr:ABC transporter permease subunit [Desulfitobacterium metallireducens]AHF08054.1 ABC transporter permease [Desulfitobacterium metallireducens DSM 15288]